MITGQAPKPIGACALRVETMLGGKVDGALIHVEFCAVVMTVGTTFRALGCEAHDATTITNGVGSVR